MAKLAYKTTQILHKNKAWLKDLRDVPLALVLHLLDNHHLKTQKIGPKRHWISVFSHLFHEASWYFLFPQHIEQCCRNLCRYQLKTCALNPPKEFRKSYQCNLRIFQGTTELHSALQLYYNSILNLHDIDFQKYILQTYLIKKMKLAHFEAHSCESQWISFNLVGVSEIRHNRKQSNHKLLWVGGHF